MNIFVSPEATALINCASFAMFCVMYRTWEKCHQLKIQLYDVVEELQEARYLFSKANRKLSVKQIKYVEGHLLKKNYYILSEKDRNLVDFYKDQLSSTNQWDEVFKVGQDNEIETIDVPSSIVS